VRTLASLMTISLAGCSQVLGIQDPSPGGRIDGGVDAPDNPNADHLMFSIGDFKVAQQQMARFRVLLVHPNGGGMEDVSATARLSSDDDTIATIGQLNNGAATIKSGQAVGTATISASLAGAVSATVKATVTMKQCHPVINELLTSTTASPDEEWIEVYNPCSIDKDVNGWTLDYRGAGTTVTADSVLIVTLVNTMIPGEIRLFGSMLYQGPKDGTWPNANGILGGGSGAVGLRAGPITTGPLMDAVGYGAVVSGNPFRETNPVPAMSADVSASRGPFDGKDDDDGITDFKITTKPTPRALNVP
jgi:hypothetical protein